MEDQIYSAFFVVADNKSWKVTYACDFTSLYMYTFAQWCTSYKKLWQIIIMYISYLSETYILR